MLDIVLIDDEIDNVELLTEILEDAGYHVRPTTDPNLALMSIQAKQPKLILCDINMPTMTGYELYEILQQKDITKTIPFIFISGSELLENRPHGFARLEHVMKPIKFNHLIRLIEDFIGNQDQ